MAAVLIPALALVKQAKFDADALNVLVNKEAGIAGEFRCFCRAQVTTHRQIGIGMAVPPFLGGPKPKPRIFAAVQGLDGETYLLLIDQEKLERTHGDDLAGLSVQDLTASMLDSGFSEHCGTHIVTLAKTHVIATGKGPLQRREFEIRPEDDYLLHRSTYSLLLDASDLQFEPTADFLLSVAEHK